MHCPGGNATDPIWRVLASSDGISSWTPLKPQHSNPNPNPLAHQLWSIDFLTPPTPLIIPHRLPAFLESLMPLKNWCSINARWSESSLKHSIHFCGIFSSLKQNFIAYRSSKVSDCIFEIHQLWQSSFCRVYSISCCSCSFEPEIIKIGQTSHKMHSNKILNFPESTTILNARTKKVWKSLECITYIYIYIYILLRAPGDTLAPFLFITCLGCVLRTSIDLIKWLHANEGKKQTISCRNHNRRRLCRWSITLQIHLPKPNPYGMA